MLSVDPSFYEETLDWDLLSLVSANTRIERVAALPVRPVRVIGDIAVRSFLPLLRRILTIVDREHIDFLYLPVPPFLAAPLGRLVHGLRGVPYGIDYIDPWIHHWPGSENRLSKAWISRKLGEVLEPFAVRSAVLITGVAEGYFEGVLERHPHLKDKVVTAAMPYGGEQDDHDRLSKLGIKPHLFEQNDRFNIVYAGAMLPKAYEPLERVFKAIDANRAMFNDVCFHFIGTGKSPDDANGFNIRPLAERHGLWGTIVREYPARIPYLDVLVHLQAASGVFVLGSTEAHYTPSKVYQGVLSGKPIFAILHSASSACGVLQQTGAGRVLDFSGEGDLDKISKYFVSSFTDYRAFSLAFDPGLVDRVAFDAYSARSTTRKLVEALELSLERASNRSSIDERLNSRPPRRKSS